MNFYIETERLLLRELNFSDVEGMFTLDSNPKVHQYLGNKPITTIKQAEENIAYIQQQYKDRGIGRFAVIEKISGDFIGWAGLKLNVGKEEALNGFENFIDIGYRLLPKYWRKGYASEAAFASLEYGFTTKKYQIIYGAADTENVGSNAILQKIGLQLKNEFLYTYTTQSVKVNWYDLNIKDYGN